MVEVLASVAVAATVNDDSPLKNYGGMVSAISIVTGDAGETDVVTYSGVCEATVAGDAGDGSVASIDDAGAVTCTDGVALGQE